MQIFKQNVSRISKLASSVQKLVLVGALVTSLLIFFAYGVLVGKYQYPPYSQVAPLYQKFYNLRESLIGKSPLYSQEAIKLFEQSQREQDSKIDLIAEIRDDVTDLILSNYKPYDIPLGSPIGYILGYSVKSGSNARLAPRAITTFITTITLHGIETMSSQ